MATLKKRRDKWYARVFWYDNTGMKKEKQVPLRTDSKVTARKRMSEVEKHSDEIIELHTKGESYSFPWMNDDGILKIDYFNFKDTVYKWLRLRKSDGIANGTIERNEYSLKSIISVIGENIRLSQITIESIEMYKDVMRKRGYKPHGININLRALRTFLNWCIRSDYIIKALCFSMVKTEKSLPSYIADGDFAEIMKLELLDEHYKQVFQFYRDTGCRLSEPFIGKLIGTVLVIHAKQSKSRVEREIELDVKHVAVVMEMQKRYQSWQQKVNKPVLKYFAEKYSKEFKHCCKTIGIDRRFHDLRHTFAVRRYLMTHDIYYVMKAMGHSKITTTEIYSKFNMRRLETDFPSLAESYHKTVKFGKVDTLLVDTERIYSC